MKRESSLVAVLVLVALGCTGKKSPVEAETETPHIDEETHEAMARQVRVPEAVIVGAGITTAPARRVSLASTIVLTGEVVPEPDRTSRISSAVAGRLEQVRFNEGDVVKRGDVLATLRVPDVGRLRGALAAASARAQAAQSNAERLQTLKESGLGADQAVVDAQADARAQQADASALREQLRAIGVNADSAGGFLVEVRAPISGVVVARTAIVAQPIAADAVLGTIVDLSEVWFLGRVFEKDLSKLSKGALAEVELNAFPKKHFHGTVSYVSQQIDPTARTLTARLRLDNTDGRLSLGLFGRAHVQLATGKEVEPQVVVPRDALVEIDGKNAVFIRAADGDFVLHDVTLGDAAMDDVQVLSGVDRGEQVAVTGVFTLKSMLLKSTLAEDE